MLCGTAKQRIVVCATTYWTSRAFQGTPTEMSWWPWWLLIGIWKRHALRSYHQSDSSGTWYLSVPRQLVLDYISWRSIHRRPWSPQRQVEIHCRHDAWRDPWLPSCWRQEYCHNGFHERRQLSSLMVWPCHCSCHLDDELNLPLCEDLISISFDNQGIVAPNLETLELKQLERKSDQGGKSIIRSRSKHGLDHEERISLTAGRIFLVKTPIQSEGKRKVCEH